MTITEAIQYFGNKRELARICGFKMALPHLWKFRGFIPIAAQMQIEEITDGKLKARLVDGK